jgi:hypothetical protein
LLACVRPRRERTARLRVTVSDLGNHSRVRRIRAFLRPFARVVIAARRHIVIHPARDRPQPEMKVTMSDRQATCVIDGCDRPAHARGWCSVHYNRFLRHGDPCHNGWHWGDEKLKWKPGPNHVEWAVSDDQEYRICTAELGGYRLHRIPGCSSWWHRRNSWCPTRLAARALAEEWAHADHDRRLPSQGSGPTNRPGGSTSSHDGALSPSVR